MFRGIFLFCSQGQVDNVMRGSFGKKKQETGKEEYEGEREPGHVGRINFLNNLKQWGNL